MEEGGKRRPCAGEHQLTDFSSLRRARLCCCCLLGVGASSLERKCKQAAIRIKPSNLLLLQVYWGQTPGAVLMKRAVVVASGAIPRGREKRGGERGSHVGKRSLAWQSEIIRRRRTKFSCVCEIKLVGHQQKAGKTRQTGDVQETMRSKVEAPVFFCGAWCVVQDAQARAEGSPQKQQAKTDRDQPIKASHKWSSDWWCPPFLMML